MSKGPTLAEQELPKSPAPLMPESPPLVAVGPYSNLPGVFAAEKSIIGSPFASCLRVSHLDPFALRQSSGSH